MKDGWIKLHRKLLDNVIWKCSTPEQKVILITLLLMASHKDNQWIWKGKKFVCKPGQFITSLKALRKSTGCSSQNIRTSLVKFEKLEFLTNESTKTGRLITIINWDAYQDLNEQANKATNKELTKNQQRANNYQECKNDKNKRKRGKNFAPPTLNAVIKYFQENGHSKEYAIKAFKYYSEANWHDSKGQKVKNWKQKMIGNWFKTKKKPKTPVWL